MSRLRVVSVLVATVIAAACGSTSEIGTSANSYAGKTIKLGAILSITGQGSAYGPSSREGMELAVEQINKSGGVNGATISLTVRDDASTQSQSAQVAQTMIQSDQDLALLGPTLSNSAVAVHPLAENHHIPILAVSTTGINIVPNCNFPSTVPCRYVFRDSLGEETAIPDNVKSYAADAKPTTGVLLVARDDKFSIDGGRIVEATVGQYDLSSYVTQAVQLNPDVIFITSLGGIPAEIMHEARKQGWQGQFLGGNGFNTATVSKDAGADGADARSASAWYLGNTFRSNTDFVTTYKAKYANLDGTPKNPDQFAAQGFTAIKILADAARRANLAFSDLTGDRDKLRTAMETVNIESPLGPFQFTSTHDVKQTVWIIKMDGRGGFTLVHEIKAS
jgi:branched-chain amino acid transport system substrate-binding protein